MCFSKTTVELKALTLNDIREPPAAKGEQEVRISISGTAH